MPVANRLTVPERAFSILRALAEVPEAKHKALRDSLAGSPALTTPDDLVDLFSESLGFVREDSQALVAETFSMAHAVIEHGHTAQSAAKDVSSSSDLKLSGKQQTTIATTVELLLTAEVVIGLASAASVFTAHERLFTSARVHIDVRPVFDVTHNGTIGSVITRKLQLGYFENGEYRSLEIAFQDAGYAELIRMLESGRKDALITSKMLAAAGSTIYTFDDSERED